MWVRIISIANHHQWDGLVLTAEEFSKLIDTLELSKFQYSVKTEEVK
jgi:hypothetical protein